MKQLLQIFSLSLLAIGIGSGMPMAIANANSLDMSTGSKLTTIAQASSLTEAEVREHFKKVEAYTNQRDVQQLMAQIDANATFTVTSDVGGETLLFKASDLPDIFKDGYEGLQKDSISMTVNAVEIEGNKAIVKGVTVDRSTTESGLNLTTTQKWTQVLEKRDGKLLVLKSDSVITAYCVSSPIE